MCRAAAARGLRANPERHADETGRPREGRANASQVLQTVRERHEMDWVAGVDGFKSEWCLVLLHLGNGELRSRIVPSFSLLIELPERPTVICVDIPIGLPKITPKVAGAARNRLDECFAQGRHPYFRHWGAYV